MYICSCNPFTDRHVREFLDARDEQSSVAEVYSHCSGGEKPGCCTCLKTLKDIVSCHNKNKTSCADKTEKWCAA